MCFRFMIIKTNVGVVYALGLIPGLSTGHVPSIYTFYPPQAETNIFTKVHKYRSKCNHANTKKIL